MKSCLFVIAFIAFLCVARPAVAAPPPDARLVANPFVTVVDQPVTFTGFVGTGTVLPAILAFGDGQQQLITRPSFSVSHAYGRPGSALVVLKTFAGAFITATGVDIAAFSPQLPLGAIYATSVDVSPVLAGSIVNVNLSYRIVLPTRYGTISGQQPPGFQVIVDLEDGEGNLVHRSDPTPLFPLRTDAISTISITYSVPVDAHGPYRLRAFIQAIDRGTVALGAPTTINITGNGQSDVVDARGVHAAGSVEAGHYPQISETVNPQITVSRQQGSATAQAGAISDPVSNRIDGLLVLTSLLPKMLTSPNALDTQPKQPPPLPYVASSQYPQYYDAFGRSMAPMPDILGGFSTVRGANAVYRTAPGWIFQASAGNTELYTSYPHGNIKTFEQFGDVFELGRFWSPADSLAFVHHGRGDNPSRFYYYPQQPEVADVNALEGTKAIGRDLAINASVAASTSHPNFASAQSTSDSGDLMGAAYNNGASSVDLQYHNFGQSFTPGNGMQAESDRAGTIVDGLFPAGANTQLGFNWDHEATRSVAQTQVTASAFVNVGFSHGMNAQLTAARDRELTQIADLATGTVAFHLGRGDLRHSFLVDGEIISAHDYVNDRNSSTSRLGSVQYSFQSGIQAIGVGVTTTEHVGFFPQTTVTESVTDGFVFGGRERRIGLQMGLANSNLRYSFYGGGSVSDDLTGSLTYRIVRGVTCGLKAERTLYDDAFPQNDRLAGGMRFLLIVDH